MVANFDIPEQCTELYGFPGTVSVYLSQNHVGP